MLPNIVVPTETHERAPSSISHPPQQWRGEAPPGKMMWRYFRRQRLPKEFLLIIPFQLGLPKRLSPGKLRKFSFFFQVGREYSKQPSKTSYKFVNISVMQTARSGCTAAGQFSFGRESVTHAGVASCT